MCCITIIKSGTCFICMIIYVLNLRGLLKMKKILSTVVLGLSLLLAASPVMAATGFYDAGASSPNIVIAGQANLWGQPGYWDLTNNASIPTGAKITSMYESWTSQYPNTGLVVALFKADGNGWYTTSGANISGASGALVKQKWSTRCNAKVNTWIWPVLRLYWSTPASATMPASEGMTTLLSDGSSETSISDDVQSDVSIETSVWDDNVHAPDIYNTELDK